MPNDTRHSAEKKRQILEAASRVFRRKGLAGTGMRDIAAELGMHVGNLYYYFDSKQALLAFCQEDALDSLLELAERVDASGLRADAQLALLVVGHLRCLNEETPGSLAHLEVEALAEGFRDGIVRRRDAYEAAVRRLIDEGVAAGVFRPVDSKLAALAVLGALNWSVKWFRRGGPESATSIGRRFADQLVRGLLTDGVRLDEPDVDRFFAATEPGSAPDPTAAAPAGAPEPAPGANP